MISTRNDDLIHNLEGEILLDIFDAAKYGDVKAIKSIIAKGLETNELNLNALNMDARSALHIAAEYNHIKVVRLLLAAGANVDGASVVGFTSLYLAAMHGNFEVAQVLIAAGADVNNAQNVFEASPLHEAVISGQFKIVQLLLMAGANVDAIDDLGQTPLYKAAIKSDFKIMRLLLVPGAKLSLVIDHYRCSKEMKDQINQVSDFIKRENDNNNAESLIGEVINLAGNSATFSLARFCQESLSIVTLLQ